MTLIVFLRSGSQTYDRISEFLCNIISEFNLEGKVQHIVTDYGLNFVKAVKDYLVIKACDSSVVVTETFSESETDVELVDNNDESIEVELEILDNDNETLYEWFQEKRSTWHVWLPAHIRCASHTLNLLAKTDGENIITSCPVAFTTVYQRAMRHIKAIWNKCGRSTNVAPICLDIIGKRFINFWASFER